jgi:hypothetical protein
MLSLRLQLMGMLQGRRAISSTSSMLHMSTCKDKAALSVDF